MEIASIQHKGLLAYFTSGDSKGLRQDLVLRLQNILTALEVAADVESLEGPPGWRIHQLKGDRAGVWSISVSGNWRLTFTVKDNVIHDLNLEDYH
ncbi:MAG: type II toxin-antitoxin system RelE/ParE family toxin [Pseudomonadota bacterium]